MDRHECDSLCLQLMSDVIRKVKHTREKEGGKFSRVFKWSDTCCTLLEYTVQRCTVDSLASSKCVHELWWECECRRDECWHSILMADKFVRGEWWVWEVKGGDERGKEHSLAHLYTSRWMQAAPGELLQHSSCGLLATAATNLGLLLLMQLLESSSNFCLSLSLPLKAGIEFNLPP